MGPGVVLGVTVRFVCRRCGNRGRRPMVHLERAYGARSLAEVARRARCLAYVEGVRCGGLAEVSFEEIVGAGRPS